MQPFDANDWDKRVEDDFEANLSSEIDERPDQEQSEEILTDVLDAWGWEEVPS